MYGGYSGTLRTIFSTNDSDDVIGTYIQYGGAGLSMEQLYLFEEKKINNLLDGDML